MKSKFGLSDWVKVFMEAVAVFGTTTIVAWLLFLLLFFVYTKIHAIAAVALALVVGSALYATYYLLFLLEEDEG